MSSCTLASLTIFWSFCKRVDKSIFFCVIQFRIYFFPLIVLCFLGNCISWGFDVCALGEIFMFSVVVTWFSMGKKKKNLAQTYIDSRSLLIIFWGLVHGTVQIEFWSCWCFDVCCTGLWIKIRLRMLHFSPSFPIDSILSPPKSLQYSVLPSPIPPSYLFWASLTRIN